MFVGMVVVGGGRWWGALKQTLSTNYLIEKIAEQFVSNPELL